MFWEALSGGVSDIVQYSNDNNKYIPFGVTGVNSTIDFPPTPSPSLTS